MSREYIIDNEKYMFSKEDFQFLIREKYKMEKNKPKVMINKQTFYENIASDIGVSSETIRKWYSNANSIGPSDIELVQRVADVLCEGKVNLLLTTAQKETVIDKEYLLSNDNCDRQLVISVYHELLDITDKLLKEEQREWEVFEGLIEELRTKIDKEIFDVNPITINKLHMILNEYLENLTCPQPPYRWELIGSEYLWMVRDYLRYTREEYEEDIIDGYEDQYYEYLCKYYPDSWDDSYSSMPISFSSLYRREITISLANVFREDFSEYFRCLEN